MKNPIMRRIIMILLCLLLCCPASAYAAASVDTAAQCSLTLHYTQEDAGLEGLEIALHRVGEVFSNGTYALTAPYNAYPVNIQGITSQQEWQDVAATLQAYITADGTKSLAVAAADATGTVSFENLQTGLYLISGVTCETKTGICLFDPFLMFLPRTNEDTYDYHVDAKPKHSQFVPNPETEEYSVLKLWKDEAAAKKRPISVTVDILKSGAFHETVILNADNNWYYSWTAQPGDTWTVVEKQVPEGYDVTISANGTAFVITNTYEPDEPGKPEPPKTGDTAPLVLYIVLTCLSGLLLLILGIHALRGKKHDKKR